MYCKIILVCAFAASVQCTSKYSKDANEDSVFKEGMEFEPNPFKMRKVNLLWNKAKKRVTGQDLADLYADLKMHDIYEADLKRLKSENLDKDGLSEEKVLLNYKRILTRYLPDNLPPESKENNEIPGEDIFDVEKEFQYQDPKLQSIWKRAQQGGFSEADLKMLKQEFDHQAMKINEYMFMRREIFGDDDEDVESNTVDKDQKFDQFTFDEFMEKMGNVKKRKVEVRAGYKKLEQLATSLPSSMPEFADPRIMELWALAKKTNWTEEELESFQHELRHFETRVTKHKYYKSELQNAQEAVDAGEGEEAIEKHDFMNQRASVMKKKITQIHGELQSRVEAALQHTEL